MKNGINERNKKTEVIMTDSFVKFFFILGKNKTNLHPKHGLILGKNKKIDPIVVDIFDIPTLFFQ